MTSQLIVMRDKVLALEAELQKLPQVDCPVRHHFSPGIYAREITIPAGVALTGAVHRHEHLCTVAKGIIHVSEGGDIRVMHAGDTIVSSPGAKRVGYAVEESVWLTYHPNPTNERDIDTLMASIIEDDVASLIGGEKNVQKIAENSRNDYLLFLSEYGLTEEFVRPLVENLSDQVGMPEAVTSLRLAPSPIQGIGMFTTRPISKGECIAPARLNSKRTPAGRFINHSGNPNAYFMPIANGDLMLYSLRDIPCGEEVLIDYRQAMKVNGAGFEPVRSMK